MHEQSGLTRNQFFFWLGQKAAPKKPLFNELAVFILEGSVDRSYFEQSVLHVVNHTDALRTVVHDINEMPEASVLDSTNHQTHHLDLSEANDPESALDAWAQMHVESRIDLSKRCFELTLIKLSTARYAWALLQHHILFDATSVAVIHRRISDCYELILSGQTIGPIIYPPFADYIAFESENQKTERFEECQSYWQSKTAEIPAPVTFFGDRMLGANHGMRRERLNIDLGAERSAAIMALARSKGIRFLSDDLSAFNLFISGLYVYLFRISGQRTIAIGVPWQNRRKAYRETVGLLMEVDPFIVSLDGADTFATLVRKVRKETLSVMRHLPYAAGNPGGRFYDVSFNYTKDSPGDFAGLEVQTKLYRPSYFTESLSIRVHDFGNKGEFSVTCEFNGDLFSPEERTNTSAHFVNCLMACVEAPDRVIGSVDMLSAHERDSLLYEWNDSENYFPENETMVGLFEEQVKRYPSALSASCSGTSLTYLELSCRSTALARHLSALGAERGVLVGICVDRSLNLLVALLGTLKTGAAFVPLDPAFPTDRLSYMLSDSGVKILITQTDLLHVIQQEVEQTVCLDHLNLEDSAVYESTYDVSLARSEDLAYVLYTSGSTGVPKGVEVTHRALTNLLCAMQAAPGFSAEDVLLAVTTLSFDIAGLELFLPLICGGRVEIAPRDVTADGQRLKLLLESSRATVMQATPATWRMLIESDWKPTSGIRVLCGGEALPKELALQLMSQDIELWNMYGPTEATIWSSVKRIDKADDEISIGSPIANTQFYVVDDYMQLVPAGMAGELLIGGVGLASGYRNQPKLTAERFVSHPFSEVKGERVYRTGDLVRWTPDGELIHLGRLDNQVKIRGFRIETGEVESLLDKHPRVLSSVVVAQNSLESSAYLAAYVVCDSSSALGTETAVSLSELRRYLARQLPEYMVPSSFVFLDEFPLTPNGKIDRKALPKPDQSQLALDNAYVAPRSETEHVLVTIWESLLKREQVGVQDDFFELGGQSLLALQMRNRVRESLGVDIPLQTLSMETTISGIARAIGRLETSKIENGASSTADGRAIDNVELSDTESRLLSIWKPLLGKADIDLSDEFFDLAGESNLLEIMIEETRSEFGNYAEGLSIPEFRAAPTIKALAKTIDGNISEASNSLVVPLQPLGENNPIFFVHAAGGYVFFYRALSRLLGSDRAIYGIRAATDYDSDRASFLQSKSVEAIAAQYIEEIKRIQPQGPYTLGGACFGAIVAYEMAQQLVAKGEKVESPVIVFSSLVWNNAFVGQVELEFLLDRGYYDESRIQSLSRRMLRQLTRIREFGFSLATVEYLYKGVARESGNILSALGDLGQCVLRRAIPAKGAGLDFRETGCSQGQGDPSIVDEKTEKLWADSLEHSLKLGKSYRPEPFSGSIAVFQASLSGPCAKSWDGLAQENFFVYDLPGLHLDILEEPTVSTAAHLISSLLRESNS